MNLDILRGSIYSKYKSQAKFADDIGWHPNKVNKLLNGKFIPDVEQAEQLAKKLKMSLDTYRQIFLPTMPPNGGKLG